MKKFPFVTMRFSTELILSENLCAINTPSEHFERFDINGSNPKQFYSPCLHSALHPLLFQDEFL